MQMSECDSAAGIFLALSSETRRRAKRVEVRKSSQAGLGGGGGDWSYFGAAYSMMPVVISLY